ncbi:anti-sigma factor family protein [Kitasatospora sp. NPDC101183]|uniref:anti-sigma factor family protein n=1 Tax=Kitasatospora sp. NPDC101183 TaxID=3364100 RepID=UPI003820EFA8
MSAPLSSPEPADAHPGVDDLADLAEGLVEPDEAAEALWRHLDGCDECRETVEALAEVRDLLGAVEAPPMPADVAARLDAALAAEAAATPATPAPSTTPRPLAAPPTAPLAAPPTAPSARPAASGTGPGRSRRPWRRRLGLLAGTAAALAAVGLTASLVLHDSDRTATSAAGSAAKATAAAKPDQSGGATVYREDQLTSQVQQLLARSGTPQPPAEPGLRPSAAQPAEGRPEQPALGSPATGPSTGPSSGASTDPSACPAPATGVPLATDRGSYEGAPVEVLVYPSPGDRSHAEVYLRAPGCGPVLLHRTVAVH